MSQTSPEVAATRRAIKSSRPRAEDQQQADDELVRRRRRPLSKKRREMMMPSGKQAEVQNVINEWMNETNKTILVVDLFVCVFFAFLGVFHLLLPRPRL